MKNRTVAAAVCVLLISTPATVSASNSGIFHKLAYNIECEFVRHAAKSAGAEEYKYEESGGIAVLLEGGRLKVYASRSGTEEDILRRSFATERNIYVTDFILADLDGDSSSELIFSLWKRGSFGPYRPSWHAAHEASDDEISSHLYIYSVRGGRLLPIWCSSAVSPAIRSIGKKSVTDYGVNRQVMVIERINGDCALWIWRSWGLELFRDKVHP